MAVLNIFMQTVLPMYSQLAQNIHEAHTLAETRNTLLPKLLSGEVRVSVLDDYVEKEA